MINYELVYPALVTGGADSVRIMAHLSARSDTAYQADYHYKLHGRIWRALKDSPFSERHGDGMHTGFAYSNPFPPQDMREGDDRKLIVASANDELLAYVAANLLEDPELNIGEMPFHVDDVTRVPHRVGEPGTSGVIESGTGVMVRIAQDEADKYGIEPEGDSHIYWQPEHQLDPFRDKVEANLQWKHDQFCPEHLPGPVETGYNLFDSYECFDSYAVPLTVTTGQTMTAVLTKWRFEYRVRDDDHRRHLNLALDVGLGQRNGLGLGFLNIVEGGA